MRDAWDQNRLVRTPNTVNIGDWVAGLSVQMAHLGASQKSSLEVGEGEKFDPRNLLFFRELHGSPNKRHCLDVFVIDYNDNW